MEVTPEMIAAGVREFCGYEPDLERPQHIVADIFRAMTRAKVRPSAEVGDLGRDIGVLVDFARKVQQEESDRATV
jgi:hypothetical protein